MSIQPVDLHVALASFEEIFSPRVVARMNTYDIRIAKVLGEFIWHTHTDTDEFFLVLDGRLCIALRDGGGERAVTLDRGSVFVVPRGIEHKPSSRGGASIMMFEPTGTPTVGDQHETIPGHITPTTGHPLVRGDSTGAAAASIERGGHPRPEPLSGT